MLKRARIQRRNSTAAENGIETNLAVIPALESRQVVAVSQLGLGESVALLGPGVQLDLSTLFDSGVWDSRRKMLVKW